MHLDRAGDGIKPRSMESIQVQHTQKYDDGWSVDVEVGDSHSGVVRYKIIVDQQYYRKLAPRRTLEELILGTLHFLLSREPKEAILKSFNLRVVREYFPDFEEEIKKELSL